MIYDCFLYNGEKELLEIRLDELSKLKGDIVHVIIESNVTHTEEAKPLYFAEQFGGLGMTNIHYHLVENMPLGTTPRQMEAHQRNEIINALKWIEPHGDDYVIISDVDEIPRARSLNEALQVELRFAALIMDKYNYYVNLKEGDQNWDRARWMKWGYLQFKKPEEVRNSGYDFSIHHAGWHFSWMGGGAEAVRKLKSFSHQELNTTDNIERVMKAENIWDKTEFKKVEVDLSYPEILFRNQEKFKKLIL